MFGGKNSLNLRFQDGFTSTSAAPIYKTVHFIFYYNI